MLENLELEKYTEVPIKEHRPKNSEAGKSRGHRDGNERGRRNQKIRKKKEKRRNR